MKNYDEIIDGIESISDNQRRLKYSALASSLPLISVIRKLIYRKNEGKKPFTPEFSFEKKVRLLDDANNDLQKILSAELLDCLHAVERLNDIRQISLLASQEIKNESLKGDFLFVIRQIDNIIVILKA
ncbi:MAG: hypothetical protein WCR67_04255 [Bacilli bacterium]